MAVTGKYRRATLTIGSAVANVANFKFTGADKYDRRTGDKDMSCKQPVKLLESGSGSFTLVSGALPAINNTTIVAVVEDVAVASGGTETVTSRTLTFANCTANNGMSADNNGGESSRDVSFEYGTLTET